MSMTVSGPPWVVDIPPTYLSPTQCAAVAAGLTPRLAEIPYVLSGMLLPTTGALTASIAQGDAVINGVRIILPATAPGFAANRDNYVDLTYSTATYVGYYVVTPVTIGAAAPAMPPNSLRLGKVVTSTVIDSALQTGKDSQGNWMRNLAPNQITSCLSYSLGQAVSSGTPAKVAFTAAAHANYDNAYGHSVSTPSRFYALYAGVYTFTCWLDINSAGAGADFLEVYLAESPLQNGYVSGVAGVTHQIQLVPTTAFALEAGQYVQAVYSVSAGSNSISRAAASLVRVG